MLNKQIEVLVVGFGMMGCRHVQALLNHKEKFSVHLFEPSLETIFINCEKIGASASDFKYYQHLSDIPNIDLAIVATSSAPRFEIVKTLLHSGCKLFLLEKIVFQSGVQFLEIIELMEKSDAKAYCNFVNRYFDAYNEIKQELSKDSCFEMLVYGNAFGLGCNAIHYIDIFQYLTCDNNLKIESSSVSRYCNENKRGDQYLEFIGTLKLYNFKGDKITIIADPEFFGGVSITIRQENRQYLLSEQSQSFFKIGKDLNLKKNFTITPTSKLSDKIVLEIFNGNCRLTLLEETFNSHELLFEVFNNCLLGKHRNSMICPIT